MLNHYGLLHEVILAVHRPRQPDLVQAWFQTGDVNSLAGGAGCADGDSSVQARIGRAEELHFAITYYWEIAIADVQGTTLDADDRFNCETGYIRNSLHLFAISQFLRIIVPGNKVDVLSDTNCYQATDENDEQHEGKYDGSSPVHVISFWLELAR